MSAAYYPQVQEIYVAYYGRPADPAGLQYWAGQLAANRGNLSAIINAFGNSSESTALYAGASNSAKVTAIYQQIFNRAPDSAGLTFYTNALTAGTMTAASIALNVADGATGVDATYLANKLTVAQAFSDALTTDSAANLAYTGTTAATAARALITGVTTSAATTNVASTITSIKAGGGGSVAGQTFTLTTGTNSISGTSGNDTFSAATGTLQSADTILDSSRSDSDTLSAVVTAANLAPRLQNIETINANGLFVTTGIDLANVSGTVDLNLAATIAGGTATVTNAASINAENISVIGANISTLNVTATASGTRNTVDIAAGAANLNLTGGAALDSFQVTGTGNIVLATFAAIDDVTINLSDATTSITGDGALGSLTINQTGTAGTITILGNELTADLATTGTARTTITGNQNVTLIAGTAARIQDTALVNSGTGTVTVRVNADLAATGDLSDVAANVIQINNAITTGNTITTNVNSTIRLTENTGGISVTYDQAEATGTADTALTAGTGTLVMEVAHNQTDITTGAAVGSVLLSAGVDPDVTDGSDITITELVANANTNTIIVNGSNDLAITTLNINGDELIVAQDMTGSLTITTVDAGSTMALGSGNDTIGTAGGNTVTGSHTIRGGGGNDTITFGALATAGEVHGDDGNDTITVTGAAAQTLTGGAGNDSITGSANADSIDGGTGNDTLVGAIGADTINGGDGDDTITPGAGANVVSTGAGADRVRLAVGDGATISDFVLGTDRLVLTGTTTDTTIDLRTVTPANGLYTIATADFAITLTGNTGTDLTGSVQLGRADNAALTLVNASTVVGGNFDDHIALAAASSATVTGGAGADTFYKAAGAGVLTVSDFVVGTDKIVLTGAAGANISLAAAKAPASGAYTDIEAGNFDFTLTGISATDVSNIIQLGSENSAFTGDGDGAVVGGRFDDYITTGTSTTVLGTSAVTGGLGKDRITISTANELDTINFAAGDSTTTAWDEITGYNMNATAGDADVLNLASTNIGSVFGATRVGSITGITVSNGIITNWAGLGATTINAANLTDAIAFLAANVGGTDTVAFVYTSDENGDGDTTDTGETSTFVFQSGATDTLIELIGITTATAIGTGNGATTITIA